MPNYPNNNLQEELLRSLQSVTLLMQNLLGDIKDHSTALATVKAKLESLTDHVDSLSGIVRDGNGKGSLITRLALAEKSVENIEEELNELGDKMNEIIKEIHTQIERGKESEKKSLESLKDFKRQKKIEKLKNIGLVIPGVIALAIELIKVLMG